MTPDFNLWVEGQMITELIRNRLVSIRVTDEVGITSDTVEICLDDRDSLLVWWREMWLVDTGCCLAGFRVWLAPGHPASDG